MSIIYKYEFRDTSPIMVPFFQSHVIHVGSSNNEPALWVEHAVPPKDYGDARVFIHIPTGQDFDSTEFEHVGSTISGEQMWHVYGAKNLTVRTAS